MKYLILWFILLFGVGVCWGCDYCIENPGEKEIMDNGIGAKNGTHQLQKDHIVLLRRINKLVDDTDKLHSMVADLEIKFMGIKRYEQICPKKNKQVGGE